MVLLFLSTFTMERTRLLSRQVLGRRRLHLWLNISFSSQLPDFPFLIFSVPIKARQLILRCPDLIFNMGNVPVNVFDFPLQRMNFLGEVGNVDGCILNVINIVLQLIVFVVQGLNDLSSLSIFIIKVFDFSFVVLYFTSQLSCFRCSSFIVPLQPHNGFFHRHALPSLGLELPSEFV